ncbi:MAG TPA: hypothetical protein IGS31_07845 [Oscillatoriales cyanobacterium M4454_W2019_049]|nr:hypothetical protein [Oscillatoriales cyanobacterium M4454_W2019_049]
MSQYERLVMMAEDELTEYSTDARKMEKLRQKIGLSVSRQEQEDVRSQLQAELSDRGLAKLVETQRQTIALPFWGIAGLGLLLGISLQQPFDLIATVAGGFIAFKVQQWGWQLEAKRLLLNTLDELADRMQNPEKYAS